jgi:hypothetical protein
MLKQESSYPRRLPAIRREPSGTVPRGSRLGSASSAVASFLVPALTGELRPPQIRPTQVDAAGITRHKTEDDSTDPLVVPSEWGVY